MPKYRVYIEGVTDWHREYIVEAESELAAEEMASECDPEKSHEGVKLIESGEKGLSWDAQVTEIK